MTSLVATAHSGSAGTSGWLHNMSVPPRSAIRHTGQPYGTRAVFALPAAHPTTPAGLLALFGIRSGRLTANQVESALKEHLNARAATLRLPSAAPVTNQEAPAAYVVSDLLTVITVLAKSSDYLYLRDKEPVLKAIRPGRRVVLILPPEWRPR